MARRQVPLQESVLREVLRTLHRAALRVERLGTMGECDRNCSGLQYRYRTNERPASCGGRDCKGDWEQSKT